MFPLLLLLLEAAGGASAFVSERKRGGVDGGDAMVFLGIFWSFFWTFSEF